MPDSSDRDVVLYALRHQIGRCAEIMAGGAATFERIARTAPPDASPWAYNGAELARELLRTAALGASSAERMISSNAPPQLLHDELWRWTHAHSGSAMLTDTSFIGGFLSQLSAERLLQVLEYAGTRIDPSRRQYGTPGFPPGLRSAATALGTGDDWEQGLAAAAHSLRSGRFTLRDARAGVTITTTQDWDPHISDLVWVCPHPNYGDVATVPPLSAFSTMISRSDRAHTTTFALLTPSTDDPMRHKPDVATETGLARYSRALRTAQLAYAAYSAGANPRQLLITDWHELAEQVTGGEAPQVDHALRLNHVGPGGRIGDRDSSGRITDVAVPQDAAFPIDELDLTRLLARNADSARHRGVRRGWDAVSGVARGLTGRAPRRGYRKGPRT